MDPLQPRTVPNRPLDITGDCQHTSCVPVRQVLTTPPKVQAACLTTFKTSHSAGFRLQYALCRPTELPGQGRSCMARTWRSASSGRISIPRTALQPNFSCTTRTSLVCARPLHHDNKPFLYHPPISDGCMALAAQQQDSAVLLARHGMAACMPWLRIGAPSATTDRPAHRHVWETQCCDQSSRPWCSSLHQQCSSPGCLVVADWTGAAPMQASGLWCTTWARRSVWQSS